MDINHHHHHHHKLIMSSSWEVAAAAASSMAMENHSLGHDPVVPLETFWPNFAAFENHQQQQIPSSPSPSSSCQIVLPPSDHHRQILNNQQMGQPEEEEEDADDDEEELGAMKEMMFKIAAMQPVDIDPATIRKPKRRNVRISDDPQSVAARHRRERISEKIRILQRLVPGGTKMDTASMLDEAIRYVKFLKRQIRQLQANHPHPPPPPATTWTTTLTTKGLISSSSSTTNPAAAPGIVANPLISSNHPMCFDNNEVIN